MASPLNEMGFKEPSIRRNPTPNFGGDALVLAEHSFLSRAEIFLTVSTRAAIFTVLHSDHRAPGELESPGLGWTACEVARWGLQLCDWNSLCRTVSGS